MSILPPLGARDNAGKRLLGAADLEALGLSPREVRYILARSALSAGGEALVAPEHAALLFADLARREARRE
mgnify:CR=1 FL=1